MSTAAIAVAHEFKDWATGYFAARQGRDLEPTEIQHALKRTLDFADEVEAAGHTFDEARAAELDGLIQTLEARLAAANGGPADADPAETLQ